MNTLIFNVDSNFFYDYEKGKYRKLKINKDTKRILGLLFLFWLFIAFIFAIDSYATHKMKGEQGIISNFSTQIYWKLTFWFPWFFLSPLVYYLSKRIPIKKDTWAKSLLFHFTASLSFTLTKVFIFLVLTTPLYEESILKRFYQRTVLDYRVDFFLVYWCILGFCYAFDYYHQSKERELKTSQLETQLAQAQLQVMKMQFQPHFLFNTLHAISALMHKDIELADQMISRLSDLLRISLNNSGKQFVTLSEELDILKNYLEIEQTRFQDRLKVEIDVARDTLNAQVPNLILQPLVENAIKHGICPYSKSGLIEIRSQKNNGQLLLKVRDNGPGLSQPLGTLPQGGIGLTNTRERLKKLYGKMYRFDLVNLASGGLEVQLKIPLQPTKKEKITLDS